MKIAELIKFNGKILKFLSENGIKINDYRYSELYDEYTSMVPKAPWPMLVWRQAMNNLGIATEEEPFYNSCALWVTMNMLYSDHAETMANKIWGKPLAEIPTETLVKTIHALALDKLKDKDGVFEIRKYFVV